jgi:hypothetical protein
LKVKEFQMMKNPLLFMVAGMMLAAAWGCSGGGGRNRDVIVTPGGDIDTDVDTGTQQFAYSDDYATCLVEDTYDEGEVTCYVDSVNGNDANDGLSEAYPVKSQSAIDPACTVVRFKRGSTFNEKLAIPTPFNNISFGHNVKVYTNYGPENDSLPHFKVSSERGRGPVVLTFSPFTIDGLHFSGARGDNTMEHDFDFDGDGITKGIVGGIGALEFGAAQTECIPRFPEVPPPGHSLIPLRDPPALPGRQQRVDRSGSYRE